MESCSWALAHQRSPLEHLEKGEKGKKGRMWKECEDLALITRDLSLEMIKRAAVSFLLTQALNYSSLAGWSCHEDDASNSKVDARSPRCHFISLFHKSWNDLQ